MELGRTFDGRWYFMILRNGRLCPSFHTYATKAEAVAVAKELIRNRIIP